MRPWDPGHLIFVLQELLYGIFFTEHREGFVLISTCTRASGCLVSSFVCSPIQLTYLQPVLGVGHLAES